RAVVVERLLKLGDSSLDEFGRFERASGRAPFEKPGQDVLQAGDVELDASVAARKSGAGLGRVPGPGEGISVRGRGKVNDDVVAGGAGDQTEGTVEVVVDVEIGGISERGGAQPAGVGEALDGEDTGRLRERGAAGTGAVGDDVEAVPMDD